MSLRRYLHIKFPLTMSQRELKDLLLYENTPTYVIDFVHDLDKPEVKEITREKFNELING